MIYVWIKCFLSHKIFKNPKLSCFQYSIPNSRINWPKYCTLSKLKGLSSENNPVAMSFSIWISAIKTGCKMFDKQWFIYKSMVCCNMSCNFWSGIHIWWKTKWCFYLDLTSETYSFNQMYLVTHSSFPIAALLLFSVALFANLATQSMVFSSRSNRVVNELVRSTMCVKTSFFWIWFLELTLSFCSLRKTFHPRFLHKKPIPASCTIAMTPKNTSNSRRRRIVYEELNCRQL